MCPKTILFLHGGPGASAIPERELYGNSLPVLWWDQLRSDVLFAKPYHALLDDVAFKAEELISGGSDQVNLVAHSFGAHLALHLALVMPENIGSITLVAPVFNVADAIARVGSHAIAIAHSPDRLIKALEQNRAQHSRFEMFWRLVEEVWAVPDVLDIYWAPGSIARKKWLRDVVEREPWLDFNTFMALQPR